MTSLLARRMIQTLMFIGLSAAVGWSLSTRMEKLDLAIWTSSANLEWSFLWMAVVLLPVNWGLEALKFRTLLSTASSLTFSRLYQSVLGGISVSMLLPNRMGECIGRLVFFPPNQRSAALSATWTGSALQLTWILFFGSGVLFTSAGTGDVIQYLTWDRSWIVIGAAGLMMGAIFLFSWSGGRVYFQAVWGHFRSILGNGAVTTASLWALLRYATYCLQFVFLLRFTGVASPWPDMFAYATLVFFFQTILPLPPALGWIGRIELAIFIGGFLMVTPIDAAIASLMLWVINLAIPGLYGGYILLNQHLYKHLDYVRTSFTPG